MKYVIYILVLLAVVAAPGYCTPPSGYTLSWSEEFNEGVGQPPSPAYWSYDLGNNGGWGNNELETYVNDLQHAQIISDPNATDGQALDIQATLDAGGQYHSARIRTDGKVVPLYGYIESRIRMPYSQGIWPAFWTLGSNIGTAGWPSCGEMDIMESIGKEPSINHGSMHGPGYSGGNALTALYTLPNGQQFKDAYHTFALQWSPNSATFYVDDTPYETRTPADTNGNPWAFNHPFFMIANMAVGGLFPGNPDGTSIFPQNYLIDYIRIYTTPYNGPHNVPGTVESEDYDNGGEGVSYHSTTTTNQGGAYRADGVGIESTADGVGAYDVSWTSPGQYLKYAVNAASAGLYTVRFRVSSSASGGTFHLQDASGNNLTGPVSVPANSGWTNVYATANLQVGTQILTFCEDTGGFSINFMTFTAGTLTIPPAPSGLSAIGGNAQVGLSWTGVPAATSYSLYRSTVSGGEGSSQVATGILGTSFVDNTVTNGTTYYYVVAGVNGLGTSGPSNEAVATPQFAPPAPPTGLTATAGNAYVSLGWTGSFGALSYSVYRGTSSGGENGTPIATGVTALSYVDSTVSNGTTYYYEVASVNAAGPSAPSNEATASPTAPFEGPYGGTPWAIPGVVQFENYDLGGEGVAYHDVDPNNNGGQYRTDGVDIENTGDPTGGGYDIGWTAPGEYLKYTVNVATAGSYTIMFRVSSGASGGTCHLADASGNNLTGAVSIPATGGWQTWTNVYATATLPAGQQILTFFEDTDAAGYNLNYMTFTVGTPAPPAAPTGLAAVASSGQAVLTWNASAVASSYNVYRGTSPGGESATAIASVNGFTFTYTNTGLTNGTTYYYTVKGVNPGGLSAASNEVTAAPVSGESPYGGTPWPIPGTVQAENYDYGGEGVGYHDVDVANNGGKYRTDGVDIETTSDVGGGYDVGWTANGEWLKYTVNVATAGVYTVSFRVAANASVGSLHLENATGTNLSGAVSIPVTGGWQNWTTVNATVTLPAGQQILKLAEDVATYNINYLTFTAVPPPAAPTGLTATAGNGQVSLSWAASSGATSYSVYRGTSAGGENTTAITNVTGVTYLNTGLTNGTTYYYTVEAVNLGGMSGPSNEASATPLPPAPAAPTGLTGTAGNSQVSLSWTANSGATSYCVYRGTSAGGESGTAIAMGVVATAYVDSGLTNGTTYYYTVEAVNLGGMSGPSNEASATPLPPAPAAPTGLTGTAGNSQVSLSWTANSGATSYCVYRGTSAGGESGTAIAMGVVATAYVDSGLTNGTTYYYTVEAVNLGGMSGPSNEASATPLPPVPGAPTGLTATAGNAQVSLSWTASPGAKSYCVYRGTSAGGESGTAVAMGVVATGYTDTGLTNGTTYYYTVEAVNLGGMSGPSNEASAMPLPPVPGAPTGLTATAGNAQVSLSWTASPGATSYCVYRGTSADGESGTAIAMGVVGTGYTDGGLTNGTTYYYTVEAVNLGGMSGPSNEASAMPLPPVPGAPTGLTATAGNAQVSLAWAASAGARSYCVYRGTLAGGESGTAVAMGVVATGYTDTGLTNGTTYYYTVEAVNLGGMSGPSNEASAMPLPPVPGAPTGLTATAANAQVSLAWAASAGATSYCVYRGTSAGGESGTAVAMGVVATGYTDTGLTNGTTYYYTVEAVNLGGMSGPSNEASAMPLPPVPGAPTGLTATAANAQVSLAWAASAGATSYCVYRGTSAGGESGTAVAMGVVATGYTDTGLTNGTTYYYTVEAVNLGGMSGPSNEASATPLPPAPAAPTGLTATAANAQVSLSWTASSGATSYNVYRGTSGGGESATVIGSVTGTAYVNTGLTNGTTYYYTVKAVNLGGTSGPSNEASATPLPPPPAAPTGLTASPGNALIMLSWTASAGATSYNVYRGTSAGGESGTVVVSVTGTSCTNIGLTNGTKYYYIVKAVNLGGISGASNEASATPLSSIPVAPTGVTASGANLQIQLSWNASSGATSYSVYRGTSSDGEGATPIVTQSGTSYLNTGLTNGVTYYYKVRARNSSGTSGNSLQVSATPNANVPAVPTGVVITPRVGNILLQWGAEKGVTGFKVYRGTTPGGEGSTPYVSVTSPTYTDNGVVSGHTYYYQFTAVNGPSQSARTSEFSAVAK